MFSGPKAVRQSLGVGVGLGVACAKVFAELAAQLPKYQNKQPTMASGSG